MAQKEIILYGKNNVLCDFLPWENLHFFKKSIIVHENHFLFESQQSILLEYKKSCNNNTNNNTKQTLKQFSSYYTLSKKLLKRPGNRTQEE